MISTDGTLVRRHTFTETSGQEITVQFYIPRSKEDINTKDDGPLSKFVSVRYQPSSLEKFSGGVSLWPFSDAEKEKQGKFSSRMKGTAREEREKKKKVSTISHSFLIDRGQPVSC